MSHTTRNIGFEGRTFLHEAGMAHLPSAEASEVYSKVPGLKLLVESGMGGLVKEPLEAFPPKMQVKKRS